MRRIALTLATLALLAAACSSGGSPDIEPRDLTATSGPEALGLSSQDDTSSTSGDETTTTGGESTTTTTTAPPAPCALPQPLPRDVELDPALVLLHRATTALAESAVGLGRALEAAADFTPGWGAREPVASAFYRMQADLYTLASLLEQTYAEAGATYSPDTGWVFPAGPYPLAALIPPWEVIPAFQAITLTLFFEMGSQADARAYYEDGGICGLVTAFSAAMDQAVAAGAP